MFCPNDTWTQLPDRKNVFWGAADTGAGAADTPMGVGAADTGGGRYAFFWEGGGRYAYGAGVYKSTDSPKSFYYEVKILHKNYETTHVKV